MSIFSMPSEFSPFQKVSQDYPRIAGTMMKQFILLAASSLIVASIAMLTFNLTNFSIPPIDVDAIALEFAARCR